MEYEKYLPVGTVVMLKGGTKRAMITGFCSVSGDNQKVYDYAGCLYPEGYLSSNQTLLFNHDQIDKVYHLGLIDDEEKNFKLKLNEMMKKIEAEKTATGTTPASIPTPVATAEPTVTTDNVAN